VALLMTLDADRALVLLVEQRHVIPAASVVAQLQAAALSKGGKGGKGVGGKGGEKGQEKDPKQFLHRYLRAIFELDPTDSGGHHALMVKEMKWCQICVIFCSNCFK
jgi:hypothetical protein